MAEEAKEQSGKKKALVAIIVLVLVIAAAIVAYSALPGMHASAPYTIIAADEVDPVLSSNLLTCEVEDADGNTVRLGDLSGKSGKPMVINLWATWCPHCVVEMDAYEKLYGEYADRVEFVMLDAANSKSELEAAREYVQESGHAFPVYFDSNRDIAKALSATVIPLTAIVSRDGKVVVTHTGEITYETMKSTFDKILSA